ncbi:hypothetical protein [Alicyclobacillus suci]|uniref:hypothetical protein n=1 Tax=Alicyclobacillus suci TaxID=2816080 RepID=UPI001A908331|nr:hypothetical protein [Alicyclobacillus suci]
MKNKATIIGVIVAGVVGAQAFLPVVADAATEITYSSINISMVGQKTAHPKHVVSNDPWAKKPTSYIPIYYLQSMLKSVALKPLGMEIP